MVASNASEDLNVSSNILHRITYYDALQLCGRKYLHCKGEDLMGSNRASQIGTGAHTFDQFLDDLPLCREITILLMLNLLSSVNID